MMKEENPEHFFYEIEHLYCKSRELGSLCELETLDVSEDLQGRKFPILKFSIGSKNQTAAALGFVGGIHGLERIGSQVCVAFLNSISKLMLWDQNTQNALENLRIFFIPTVNPAGIYNKTRANPKGVDLMRNAPIDADKAPFLLGGHFISSALPWYRGQSLERESLALIKGVTSEIQNHSMSLVIDLHSGFGLQDQIWFPYARTKIPYPHLPQTHALFQLFDETFPHHFYKIEPQASQYTTHGDLWDYIYENKTLNPRHNFIPLCLEMGSWMWIKKNPLQLFSSTGPFNPIKKHREKRILRRHFTFFEFLIRALGSLSTWYYLDGDAQNKHRQWAQDRWYKK